MSAEDFTACVGKEAIWRGRGVLSEAADEHGADVTDQDGGTHSVGWAELDAVGSSA